MLICSYHALMELSSDIFNMKIFEDSVNRKSKMSCNTGCLATVARCYCNIEDTPPPDIEGMDG